jgi:hypothetical protein
LRPSRKYSHEKGTRQSPACSHATTSMSTHQPASPPSLRLEGYYGMLPQKIGSFSTHCLRIS